MDNDMHVYLDKGHQFLIIVGIIENYLYFLICICSLVKFKCLAKLRCEVFYL